MSGQTADHYVLACASHAMRDDGTCDQWVWLPYPQQVLPPLTLAEGSMVALAIVGVWAVGLKARLIFRAARM